MSRESSGGMRRCIMVAAVLALMALGVSRAVAVDEGAPAPTPAPAAAPEPAPEPEESEPAGTVQPVVEEEDGAIDSTVPGTGERKRRLVRWNEYDGPLLSVRLGGGFLYDVVDYHQGPDAKSQFNFAYDDYIRDSRVLLKGQLKFIPRTRFTVGYMYDKNVDDWFWRQTGIYFDLPEIGGDFFVGRTKEGFSMNKIMVGYNGWTMERATANDAFIPILADGVQLRGSVESRGLAWNIGFYDDFWTDAETFNRNDNVFAARGVWQPLHHRADEQILHLGLGYRWGDDNDGTLVYKSRPESYSAPFVIDTGSFEADYSQTFNLELYYRPGSFFLGGEYFFNTTEASQSGDPFFHGGELVVTWLSGGNRRPYNPKTGVFGGIVPTTSVFRGGWGTFELVGRFSYTDLDDGPIAGGKFWRITPMVNWHMSPNIRLELVYGYGELDRFGTIGGTQFLQLRTQLQL